MNIADVVHQLKQQCTQLDAAIQALEGTSRLGRPPGSVKHRTMSAAARRRFSQAMTKRWAERKKKAQKLVGCTTPRARSVEIARDFAAGRVSANDHSVIRSR